MFLVGTTLRVAYLRSQAKSAAGVSFAEIVAPFAVAALIINERGLVSSPLGTL